MFTQQIAGFDWDEANWPKCGKHGVSQAEIEELFSLPFTMEDDPCIHEPRQRVVGRNREGRHIFVVFTYREKGNQTYIRPISARYMHKKEVETYERTSA